MKGFSFLEGFYLGKANFEKARKMTKEYQNGDIGGWHLMTLYEFRKLTYSFRHGSAWSIEQGKPCIIKWGQDFFGSVSHIVTDVDPNDEFDIYVFH
jgi:hypothetical protein